MLANFLKNLNSKGFFYLLTTNYLIGFLGLVSQLIVVKFLSPIEMGEIKTLQSFIAIISTLAGFGFNTAVLKICSEKMDSSIKRKIFSKNILYTLISISLVLIVVYSFLEFQSFPIDKHTSKWMATYLLIVPSMVLMGLFITYLQALKQIKLMAQVQAIIRLLGILFIIVFTYYYGFSGFVWTTIFVSYLGLIGIFVFVRKEIKFDFTYPIEKRNFIYANWSVAANFIGISAMYLDIFVLNIISVDKIELGYYSIATILLLGLNYITSTIQSIATPYFSEKSNDKIEFYRALKKYIKLIIFLSIGIGIFALLTVPLLLNLIYGQEYCQVGDIFKILILKYIFWSSYALVGVAVLGIGGMKFNFLIVLFTTVISFFITYYAGSNYGVLGVAYGQAISYFVSMILIILVGSKVINNHFKEVEKINEF